MPTFERAIASTTNHLALVAQQELQPYGAAGGFQDCHYYDLPWPRQAFEALGDEEVKLKVTLSYFVGPNPGALASLDPYRYQSFGLRFDLKRRLESVVDFKQRVNIEERANSKQKAFSSSDTDSWRFSIDAPPSSSLICNEWKGPAAWLLSQNMLCVKPIGGWRKNHVGKKRKQQRSRYALVVSVKTSSQNIDLYTPIKAVVEGTVPISLETNIGF